MPDGMNNVDSTVLKLAEQYHSTNVRSRELNDERKTIRENVEKLGIDPKAFQVGLMMARDMTTGERSDYTGSLTRVLSVLDGKEADLFGAEEIAKRDKRAEKRAHRDDPPTKDNPRGDPAKGGAGGVDGKKAAKDGTPKAVEPKVAGRKPGRPRKGGDNVVPIGAKKAGKIDVVSQSGVTAAEVPLVADGKTLAEHQADREQAEGGKLLDDAVEGIKEREAEERAAFSDLTGTGDEPVEDGDALIKRVAAQKMAELDARGGMDGMAPIDASGDDGPLSQSQIAAQRREAAFGSDA